jgi:hypothetical protein
MRLTAIAVLCLMMAAPAFAHHQQDQQQQQDDRDKAKQQQEDRQKQDQDAKKKQQQDDRAKQQEQTKQDERTRQEQKAPQDEKTREEQPQADRLHGVDQQQAAQANQGRTRHGGRMIPDDRYRASFGRDHHFHIGHRPNDQRFTYNGYTFEYTEAWPGGWSYGDAFYILYIDGDYYLCDLNHPGVQLLVIVI